MRMIPANLWQLPVIINISSVVFVLFSVLDPTYLVTSTIFPLMSFASHVLLYPLRKRSTYETGTIVPLWQPFSVTAMLSLAIFVLNLDLYFLLAFWAFFLARSVNLIFYFYNYDCGLHNEHYGAYFKSIILIGLLAIPLVWVSHNAAMTMICVSEAFLLISLNSSRIKTIKSTSLWSVIKTDIGMYSLPLTGVIEAIAVRYLLLSFPIIQVGAYFVTLTNLFQIIETGVMRFISRPIYLLDKILYSLINAQDRKKLWWILLALNVFGILWFFLLPPIYTMSSSNPITTAILLMGWTVGMVCGAVVTYLVTDGIFFNTRNILYLAGRFPKLIGMFLVLML
ncbi:hypothetical protein N9E91_03070 [Alphaproteobacteria bacterium]|nr:hypothetical protein [Alphaproteobacteria bacterium]